jgi:hypothetical protein
MESHEVFSNQAILLKVQTGDAYLFLQWGNAEYFCKNFCVTSTDDDQLMNKTYNGTACILSNKICVVHLNNL